MKRLYAIAAGTFTVALLIFCGWAVSAPATQASAGKIYRFGDTAPEPPYDTRIPKVYWIAGHTFASATGGKSIDALNRRAIDAEKAGDAAALAAVTTEFEAAHRAMARQARDGGYEFVMFDHEHVSPRSVLIASIDAFQSEWRPPKSSCYLGWFDAGNRNHIQEATKDPNHWIHSRAEYWRPVWDRLTHLHVGAYMLGRKPDEWKRDLDVIRASGALRDRHYPGKPLIYSIWYRLHPSWNPWPTQMTAAEIDEYHKALTVTRGDYVYFEFRWQLAPASEGSWDMHWDAAGYEKLSRMLNRPPGRQLMRPGPRCGTGADAG